MQRRELSLLLERYRAAHPEEDGVVRRFLAFAGEHEDCLLRTCLPGHFTASAWILSPDGRRCLLTRHRKLGKWLQLGGHVDGEERLELAALREAREESGLEQLALLPADAPPVPLDLDVHPIPARGQEPEHLHWDVRFLLRAGPGQELRISGESDELHWVPTERLGDYTQEDSVLRLQRRALTWLAGD